MGTERQIHLSRREMWCEFNGWKTGPSPCPIQTLCQWELYLFQSNVLIQSTCEKIYMTMLAGHVGILARERGKHVFFSSEILFLSKGELALIAEAWVTNIIHAYARVCIAASRDSKICYIRLIRCLFWLWRSKCTTFRQRRQLLALVDDFPNRINQNMCKIKFIWFFYFDRYPLACS